jgi:hypothetical protein
MLRKIILATTGFISLFTNAQQTTLYSNTFENIANSWTVENSGTPNKWQDGDCAGNGLFIAGSKAMYITDGSAGTGCTLSYVYQNSPAGTEYSLAYTPVDATCASVLTLQYDYKTGGNAADFTELVYSTDGGASWIVLGAPLATNSSWSTITPISLPPGLSLTNFHIGFRFNYNNATVTDLPTAIDNVVIKGTDTQVPTLTCPPSLNQSVNSSCQAIADDYSKNLVALADNCTDSASMTFSQTPPIGTNLGLAVGASVTITVTAFDEALNSNSCNFTLTAIDDTDPQITFCPGDTVIQVDNTCNGLVGNYASLATATDNCSSVIITQSPLAGTVIPDQGVTTLITLTYSDTHGNSTQCTLNALTVDTIPVQVVCPSDTIVYAQANCTGELLDYRGDVLATDNCVSSALLIVNQSPIPGTTISDDQVITITVTGGIPATPVTCQFNALFVDTIKPNVICPTPSGLTLNSSCQVTMPDYTSLLSWTDNCTSISSSMTFSQSPVGGSQINSNTLVTLTATDPSGNARSCSFTQTVNDNIAPALTCPGNQVLNLNNSCFATIPNYTSLVTSIENCFYSTGVSYTQSPVVGTTLNGPATITITGTDESGNIGTCSFNITVQDATNPTITCPPNSSVSLSSSCTYVLPDLSSSAVFSDNCRSTNCSINGKR